MHVAIFAPATLVEKHPDFMGKAIQRAFSYGASRYPDGVVAIHFHQDRHRDGSLELTLVFNADPEGCFVKGMSLTVLQLQRAEGEPVEYHS